MKKRMVFSALLCVYVVTPAMADIFFDDFNSESIGLNYSSFANWDVSDGSVDVIGVDSSWNWFPAYGRYVDMDGSTGNAGKITTKVSFDLAPGTYTLSFDLAGNQRQGADDTVIVQVDMGSLFNRSYTLSASTPFTTFTEMFTVGAATSAKLSFEGVGGDNVGMLLDNVRLTPVPGAVLLGMLGLSVAGIRLRKSA
jgi:hypothetical protein